MADAGEALAKRLDFHDVSLQLAPPGGDGAVGGPEEALATLGEPSVEAYRR